MVTSRMLRVSLVLFGPIAAFCRNPRISRVFRFGFMRQIRSYREVADPAGEDIIAQVTAQADRLRDRLAGIRRVVVVASGKGGVGKSAVTANLATALAGRAQRVAALDADLNGPSLARMLGASGQRLQVGPDGVMPVMGRADVSLMSTDLLLPDSAPLRWRHPSATDQEGAPAFVVQSMYEGTVLRELLADTAWGKLDYLLIDAPPGTDKLERLLQLLPDPPITILVTTPSQIARNVVARSVTLMSQRAGTTGLVLNMATQTCDRCGHDQPLFGAPTGEELERESGLSLWASIPFDPRLSETTDRGVPLYCAAPDAPAARAIARLAAEVEARS
jgi:ATP-binding protein involved in chromosome partitioning